MSVHTTLELMVTHDLHPGAILQTANIPNTIKIHAILPCSKSQSIIVSKVDAFVQTMHHHRIKNIYFMVSLQSRMGKQSKYTQRFVEQLMIKLAKSQKFVSFVDFSMIEGCCNSLVSVLIANQWKFITSLDLSRTIITPQNIAKIFKNNMKFLKKLKVRQCNINSEGAAILSQQPFLYLKVLDISLNPLGNRGVKAICKADWQQLTDLKLWWVDISQSVVKYLLKLPHKKKELLSLGLSQACSTIWQTITLIDSDSILLGIDCDAGIMEGMQLGELNNTNPIMKRKDISEIIRRRVFQQQNYLNLEQQLQECDRKYIIDVIYGYFCRTAYFD